MKAIQDAFYPCVDKPETKLNSIFSVSGLLCYALKMVVLLHTYNAAFDTQVWKETQ